MLSAGPAGSPLYQEMVKSTKDTTLDVGDYFSCQGQSRRPTNSRSTWLKTEGAFDELLVG